MEDSTTRLASELLYKLAELDQKVNEYRLDMAQEFHRYSRQLLQHVPDHVTRQVEQAIASEMQNYPALRPALRLEPATDSPPPAEDDDDRGATSGSRSPPPVLPHTSGMPPGDGVRSPHEREREFHGVFTPSYLTLLDAMQQRSSHEPTTITTTNINTPPTPPQTRENRDPNKYEDASLPPKLEAQPSRPNPVRRATEETISSTASDDSASRSRRRSALRRSSSSSAKTSPRHVRFEVEGQEVLPTASPPAVSPRSAILLPAPPGSSTSLLNESPNASFVDEQISLLGSSPPRPKKVTSTDRLKAMTRNSTEDTSQWTIVGNSQASDDEEDELIMPRSSSKKLAAEAKSHTEGVADLDSDVRRPTQPGHDLENLYEPNVGTPNGEDDEGDEGDDGGDDDGDGGDDDGDDGELEMHPLSSFKGKKRFSPPEDTVFEAEPEPEFEPYRSRDAGRPQKSAMKPPKPKIVATCADDESEADAEDMFDFEDSRGGSAKRNGKAKVVPKYIEDEDSDEDESEITPTAETPTGETSLAQYSRSPAVRIAKPKVSSPAPASTKQAAGSVGSYMGKPFSISSVRDKELYKRAAAMGEFSSFVGSVDGRSGPDESSSYRPEPTSFDGRPRSFSERLMKEELEEAQRSSGTSND
ncbi:Uu.00g003120.m01.CDS01 [Anthostomella pinea]|uniref:Uu.00g003120.m01.CDS01 n=1 Tax=Anthostomella pinea TaxID=933095 RepID=A0AAI8YIP8_9PEZI|nr:Uu.00g003120.m01.CDS01 [Anthostomella pinea]